MLYLRGVSREQHVCSIFPPKGPVWAPLGAYTIYLSILVPAFFSQGEQLGEIRINFKLLNDSELVRKGYSIHHCGGNYDEACKEAIRSVGPADYHGPREVAHSTNPR